MSKYLITIDGGTTNTRAVLWDSSCHMVEMLKSDCGVRNTAIDSDNHRLKAAVKELIDTLLSHHRLTLKDIQSIYASGMITSNVGLLEVSHLTAPASLSDFSSAVVTYLLPDVCQLPIHFIPGLKNLPDHNLNLKNIESMDIMRGEETEALALLSFLENQHGCLLVLPGSHTKFVTVDSYGKLTGCLTSLAGEMLSVLTEYSIVADAVDRSFVNQMVQREYLLAGFHNAHSTSCARAAFLTRIIHQFLTKNQNDCASYLLGSVLQNDIDAVQTSQALTVNRDMNVLIAGKEPLRSAMHTLLQEDGFFHHITVFEEESCPSLAGYGALLIAKKNGDF